MGSQPPTDPRITSATLLLRLKPGAEARELAWEEFHKRYAPIIAGFARATGAPQHEIDDVVQDVIVGFYAASPTFDYDPARGRFRSFLKVCTVRALAKRLGKSARFRGVPIDQVDPNNLEVDQAWDDVWEKELLRRAIVEVQKHYSGSEAQERTYKAFDQYVLHERDADAVAQELGVSRDSVHQAKHRVSATLATVLNRLREEQG
jgi:RNA polymerase sigma factor (sigma-70 family)